MLNAGGTVIQKLTKVLQSVWLMPCVFALAFLFWALKINLGALYLFWAVFVLILIFCKDVKNIFGLILYVSFFLSDILENPRWVSYCIIIGGAVISLIAFTVKGCVAQKGSLKRGKMFLPLVIMDVGFLLGGVIGRFKPIVFVIVLAASVTTYLLYFIALNFTVGLKAYLCKIFFTGGLVIAVQVCVSDATFFSAQGDNVAATFMLIAMSACLGLGMGKKYDVCFMLAAVSFLVGIFFSACRMALLIGVIEIIVVYALFVKYSPAPKRLVVSAVVALALMVGIALIFPSLVREQIDRIIMKLTGADITNGRISIWTECLQLFKQYPVFGYGFVADEPIMATRGEVLIILLHNTPLQWLVSLGVIGGSLTVYFYIAKYRLVFKGFNRAKIYTVICLMAVALTGLTDQAPSMDFFVFLLPLLVLASEEQN